MIVFNMKKTLFLWLLFASTSLVAWANPVYTDPGDGQNKDSTKCGYQDFTKYYNRTFSVNKSTTVVLSNKYGAIDVHTGSGSQVIVKVKVTVASNTQSQADRVFERVNIAFIEGPEFVKTETMIENQAKSTLVWSSNESQSCDFRIDYDVTMPAGNRLDISNRHGNSTIAALTTSVKIDQKYGDFRLDGASSATVFLAYGGGQLCSLNTLNGSVSYGKLTSPSIKNGHIKSIYSQFRFDQIGSLEAQSAYDTYDINDIDNLKVNCKYGEINALNVGNLSGEGSYTSFKIQKLTNNADIESLYGTIRISSLKNNFGNININGTNTNCVLVIDPTISYLLDMNGSYTNMNQPASLRTTVDNREPAHREIMGRVGSDSNTKSAIRVRMTYGEFKIK